MATKPQVPRKYPAKAETAVQPTANPSPQRPGIRPDGMGRSGSLIPSTSRSNQSFTAWLLAQTRGPATRIPRRVTGHRESNGTPEEIAPHRNAHIGGNQVTGLKSSSTALGSGSRRRLTCNLEMTDWSVKKIRHSGPKKNPRGQRSGRLGEGFQLIPVPARSLQVVAS